MATAQQDAYFTAQLDRVVEFRRTHGRLITPKDDPKLYEWLAHQRRGCHLSETRAAVLDERLPGWRERTVSRPWQDYADDVVAFYQEHGRTPWQTAKDPDEKVLGIWIRDVRVRARTDRGGIKTSPEQFAWLDQRIPGWRGRTKADTWDDTLRNLRVHVRTHGSLPTVGRLGAALNDARKRADDPAFAAKAADLDLVLPQWRTPVALATYARRARDVARFIRKHGHSPRLSGSVPPAERQLATWLGNQRSAQRGGRLSPERNELLTELLGDQWAAWKVDVSPWHTKVDALAGFVREHGRFPVLGRADESNLATFYRRQRAASCGRGNTMFNDDRRRYLDQVVPGWDTGL